MNRLLKLIPLLGVALSISATRAAETIPLRLLIVGDSTVAEYPATHTNRGWGPYIEEFNEKGARAMADLVMAGLSVAEPKLKGYLK